MTSPNRPQLLHLRPPWAVFTTISPTSLHLCLIGVLWSAPGGTVVDRFQQTWTAAIMSDKEGRDMLISSVRNFAAAGRSQAPFSDWYETTNGDQVGFQARPVAGGHLGKCGATKSEEHTHDSLF